jgi:hypothetical protein
MQGIKILRNFIIILGLILTIMNITISKESTIPDFDIPFSPMICPRSSQLGTNTTLEISKPDLILIAGSIKLNISSTTSGSIYCALNEQSGDQYFLKINQTIEIIGDNQSRIIIINVNPLITTFPGEYHFTLNITGLFTYNESFEIFLGMGYSVLSIVIIFIAIVIILFILRRRNSKKSKGKKVTAIDQNNLSGQISVPGKISCPKCKRLIDEGLSFCPECGERIPEFLRYNP